MSFQMREAAMKTAIIGRYRDVCHDAQGRKLWDSGWQNNLVVQSCYILLAALMKRETGISGILYWAVGTGDPGWDRLMPGPVPADTQLRNEIARLPMDMSRIVYLDNENAVSESPTNRLEIRASFNADALGFEGPQPLREFGLFGGDAADAAGSGIMINYVIHPQIPLSADMSLTRTLHLSFCGGAQLGDGMSGFAARLPVISIDGVGEQFSRVLNAAGVNTLDDLLQIDPLQPLENIPAVKLREFRAKARIVTGFRANLSPFSALFERSISALLQTNPEELAAETDSPTVTPERVVRMQEALAILQVALDDAVLQEINMAGLLVA